MTILNVRLSELKGIEFNGQNWNALMYADDVALVLVDKEAAQKALNVCEQFEKDGFLKWNAGKTVVLELTTSKRLESTRQNTGLYLNGQELEGKAKGKYLGYIVNRQVNDHDHIDRLVTRLNTLSHSLSNNLPLDLLDEKRLSEIINAYGGNYLLPVLDTYTKKAFSKLTTAHRNFVIKIAQIKKRYPHIWNKENNIYNIPNRYVYGIANTKQVQTAKEGQQIRFDRRTSWTLYKCHSSVSSSRQAQSCKET